MANRPQEFRLANRLIGPECQPFIVAEMSANHNQSLDRALAIVVAAAEAGADAVKLQTYTADTMTLDRNKGEFSINEEGSLWKGKSLYELYGEAHTPWEWHEPIIEHCRELGLICFSSPFDVTAVDFLETLDVPAFKIASFELTDLPLIRRAAETGKPIIISTGMGTLSEISEAVDTVRKTSETPIVLLKCTSSYPADPSTMNITTIPQLESLFSTVVGLSDHTLGIGVALGAIALGASVIEKHLTLNRAEGGVDSAFSLEPQELKGLVTESKRVWQALGKIQYGPSEGDKDLVKYRRSLYVSKPIKAGELFTKDNIRAIRPGLGLPPKYLDVFLGKTTKVDLPAGTPITWEVLV
ncbi:pseudaminic acid synthase [Acidobacteria bacterium AH-259-D05]|nr:pseudaminic acid synthase [Acidobacteria bacterium AH-259-D05]